MATQEQDAVAEAKAWLVERGVPVPPGGPGDVTATGAPPSPSNEDDSPRAGQWSPTTQPRKARTVTGGSDPVDLVESGRGPAAPAARAKAEMEVPSRVVNRELGADADPESVARSIVLRKLAARAHTRAELERALQAKHVPEEAINTVLGRMVDLNLVDDKGFARDWVESRQGRRFLSKHALRQELTGKGVDREDVDSALEAVGADDELAAAQALADKKAPALARLEPQVRYRRLAGMLARRGFSSGVVSRVLSEMPRGR